MICSLFVGGVSLYGQNPTFDLAEGPNAPQVGSIVPDTVTFSMSTTPSIDLLPLVDSLYSDFRFPNLETRHYSDFPDEVVITLYHTPW